LKSAETIDPSHRLITYVSSGRAAFADIRTRSGPIVPLRLGGDYDTAYPVALQTKPLVVLPPESWVKLSKVVDELRLAQGKDTRQIFRTTLRRISVEDGRVIEKAIKEASTK
jgi:hypothetical protein